MENIFEFQAHFSKNKNRPAFPGTLMFKGTKILAPGVDKREYFAGLAMQGILANNGSNFSSEFIIELSVKFSDAILAELDKTGTEATTCCVNGVRICPGCEGEDSRRCAGCNGKGIVTCGKCGGKNVKSE